MKKKNTARLIALMLVFMMMISAMPLTAWAAAEDNQDAPAVENTVASDSIEAGLAAPLAAHIFETNEDGVALIKNVDDLKAVSSAYSKYELTCNLDLGNQSWKPLPEFSGSFDGKGYKISGLNLDQGLDEGGFGVFYGLFAKNCGKIKNLALEGSIAIQVTSGWVRAGLLAGQCANLLNTVAQVENCSAQMTMTNANPVSKGYIASLVGQLQSGKALNCYGVATSGPILGAVGWDTEVANCYYDSTVLTSGVEPDSALTAKTTAEMQQADFVTLLNENKGVGNNEWQAVAAAYPMLVAGGVVEKPLNITVRIEGPAATLLLPTQVSVTNFDLKPYGANSNPPEVKGVHALIKALEANGKVLPDNNVLQVFFGYDGGGTITKLLGVANGGNTWLHAKNNQAPANGISSEPLKNGDELVCFYGDWVNGSYAYFTQKNQEVEVNQPLTLDLQAYKLAVEPQTYTGLPVADADLVVSPIVNGVIGEAVSSGIKTDAQGRAVLTFAKAGEYAVSAVKAGISHPYCHVLVIDRGNQGEKLAALRAQADKLAALPEFTEATADWQIMDMVAYGKRSALKNKAAFHAEAVATALGDVAKRPATDFERVAISLTAMGYDVTKLDVGQAQPLNLIDLIANYRSQDSVPSLGTPNGYMYALLAYDAGEYSVPVGAYWTKEKIIDYLIDTAQHRDGGWSLDTNLGSSSDPDITAMAISALAPYYAQPKVKTALDNAVAMLSATYLKDGGYTNNGGKNANSASFVIVALAALGIDADNDARFVLKGVSLLDHLLTFKTADGRFGYTNTTYNQMATEQGFRALISYLGYNSASAPYHVYRFGVPVPDNDATKIPVSNAVINSTLRADEEGMLVTTPTAGGGNTQTVTLPQITVVKQQAGTGIKMEIAADTKLTAGAAWDGTISLPTLVTPTLAGQTLTTAIKVGAAVDLSFDKPVRLLIPNGGAGAKVGFINAAGELHEITTQLATDEATALGTAQDGKIKVGQDLAIWTKHFTTFVVYNANSGGGGGKDISVSVSVEGDAKHGTMLAATAVTVPENSTAWVALDKVFKAKGIRCVNKTGNYISSINGLAEFTNGPNSGWYYYVNGVKPNLGVNEYTIKNGDVIDMIYTDDYQKDDPNGNGSGKPGEAVKPGSVKFNDLKNYEWAEKQILAFAEKGLIKGVAEGRFAPGAQISRGDFLTILVRMFDLKADFTQNFSDVQVGKSYYNAVGIAKKLGLTNGVGDNRFNPEGGITREEMFQLTYKVLTAQKYNFKDMVAADLTTFADYEQISAYSREALGLLVKNGVVMGADNRLNPQGLANRAEAVVFLSRLVIK